MSVDVTRALWENGPFDDSTKMLIMQILGDCANEEWIAWPTLDKLIKLSCKKKRYVLMVLAALEQEGWLTIEHRAKITGGKGNCYHLNKEKILGASHCTSISEVQPNAPQTGLDQVRLIAPQTEYQSPYDALFAELTDVHPIAPQILTPKEGRGAIHDTTIRKNRQEPSLIQNLTIRGNAIELAATAAKSKWSEEHDLITALFSDYCKLVGRDPLQYTLNEERRKKATLRFRERLKANSGDWDLAAQDMREAISNVAANGFLVESGGNDWIDNLMKSTNEFEKRLTRQPAGTKSHARRRPG